MIAKGFIHVLFSDRLEQIRAVFLQELQAALSLKDLEDLKTKYLGKKGPMQALMQELRHQPSDIKPELGKLLNELKQELSSHCENSLARLKEQELKKRLAQEWLDITLPGREKPSGSMHPISQVLKQISDVLISMGFSIQLGPDVDTDYYNFEGLNFAEDHPARDMQDTFYLASDPSHLLRTHTSNVQVHSMEKFSPPMRIAAPGRAFRNEDISARSHVFFHQVEGFYIDKEVSFRDLFATLQEFLEKLFNERVTTRFRPSYFPFVEPGVEVDVACRGCMGSGCRICKQTGWLEILGAGMIHPNVLRKGGIDPEIYSGYAWGMGIERLAMTLMGVSDIRFFTENDLRFLSQFP